MEYIDLGLPSGNLWAAENEEGYYTFNEAVAKFGDNMPGFEDFSELYHHCWKKWDDERKGLVLVADNGARLFLPAMYRGGASYNNPNEPYGYYWVCEKLNPEGRIIKDILMINYLDEYIFDDLCASRSSQLSVRLMKRPGNV